MYKLQLIYFIIIDDLNDEVYFSLIIYFFIILSNIYILYNILTER